MFKGSTVHACESTFSWSRFREEGFDADARRINVAPSFPRQMWQRSSPHCWQKWQSGQGCFPGAASERFAGSKTSFSPATGTKHPSSFRSLLPMTPPGVNLQFDHRPKHLAASHFLQSGRKRTLAQRVGPGPFRKEPPLGRSVPLSCTDIVLEAPEGGCAASRSGTFPCACLASTHAPARACCGPSSASPDCAGSLNPPR